MLRKGKRGSLLSVECRVAHYCRSDGSEEVLANPYLAHEIAAFCGGVGTVYDLSVLGKGFAQLPSFIAKTVATSYNAHMCIPPSNVVESLTVHPFSPPTVTRFSPGQCLPKLRSLVISGGCIDTESMPSLTELLSLDLSFCEFLGSGLNLSPFTCLTTLDLFGCTLGDADLRRSGISGLTQLTDLNLAFNQLDSGCLEYLPCERLQTLNLSGNCLWDLSLISRFTRLSTLHVGQDDWCLSGHGLAQVSSSLTVLGVYSSFLDVECLSAMVHLKELYLEKGVLSPEGVAAVGSLTRLQKLSLRMTVLHSTDMRLLGNLQSLVELNVMCSTLGAEEAMAIASLKSLVRLDISDNYIGDAGAIAIGSSLTRLEELYISNNHVGNAGAFSLASLRALEWLDLSSNHLDDIGIMALAPLLRLEWLAVTHNEMVDGTGLLALIDLPRLQCVSISAVEPTVKAELEAAFGARLMVKK